VWSVRDLRIILPARALSAAGTAVTTIALLLHLHDSGHGGLAIAALMACTAAPAVLTIGVAGRVADTYDSRALLAWTGAIQAAACLLLVVDRSFAAIYGATIVAQTAAAFAQPAWAALVPRASGEALIGRAIAWQQGLNAVASPTGMALGGLLFALGGIGWAFAVDAATFAVLTAAGLALRTRRNAPGEEASAVTSPGRTSPRWSDGLRIIHADRVVWPLFCTLLPMVILVEGINPAEIFLARDQLGATATQYGFVDVFAGVGAIAGSYVAGRRAGVDWWMRGCLAGFAVACACVVVNGLLPSFWAYAVVLVVLAGGAAVGNACAGALLMTRTADADRGKVQAAFNAAARACSLSALALGGVAVSVAGPRAVFVVGGLGGLVVLAVAAVVLAARRPTPELAPA
jgi:MFS family permease